MSARQGKTADYQKQYRENHKEGAQEYKRNLFQERKDTLLQKCLCECGKYYTVCHKRRHEKNKATYRVYKQQKSIVLIIYSVLLIYMFFNKPKKLKEAKRIGKPAESIQFKNALTKKLNTSGYDTIRSIVDKNEQAVIALPQVDKTYLKITIRIQIIIKI